MEKTLCTMKEIIDHADKNYGEQTAFRYKDGKEIKEKSYQDLKNDSQAFSRI